MFFRGKNKKGLEIENPTDFSGVVGGEEGFNNSSNENELIKINRTTAWVIISFLMTVLLLRSFYLQIVKGDYYKDVANNNRIRKSVIRAPRGLIKDVNEELLVSNVASFDLVFVPAYLPNESEKRGMLSGLSEIVKIPENKILELINQKEEEDKRVYLIKEDLDEEVALTLMERSNQFPGISILKRAKRKYIDGEIFSHIIGYDGKITKKELEENENYLIIDYIGKSGIEYSYEKFLRGVHGEHRFEVDSSNNLKKELGISKSVAGDQVILNIDADLQRKSTEILKKLLEENEDATGAVFVAIDPRDSGVRAMVSLPSFDNNLFVGGISNSDYQKMILDKENPLLNRAISGEYPPGSTYKPLIALAALEEGIIKENTNLDCSGEISIGKWKFPDWKIHGRTDLKKAIAESCDVFFYALGGGWKEISGLGVSRMERYSKQFGLGELLGIDLPGELDGNAPSENWKMKVLGEKWYRGDDYHAAIGQGYVTMTPLQMASLTATIASGGTAYRPRIAKAVISSKSGIRKDFEKDILMEGFVDKGNVVIVQRGMRETVIGESGSGRRLGQLKVETAGKTGTAQFGNNEKTHSWYISYGPYSDPELATVVLFEGGGEGHEWAVPATYEIYKWYFDQERGSKIEEEDKKVKDSINGSV